MDHPETNICRVCLSKVTKTSLSLFHNLVDTGLPIFSNILSIAKVNIIENDGFPDKICSQCLTELEVAVKFKKKCEENNFILQSLHADTLQKLSQNTAKIKEEFKIKMEKEIDDMTEVFKTLDDSSINQKPMASKSEDADEDLNDSFDSFQMITALNDTNDNDDEILQDLKQKPPFIKFENYVHVGDDKILLTDFKQKRLFKRKAIDLQLQCDDCKDFFKSKCKLRVHWKKVHLRKQIICQICKRNFKTSTAHQRHLQKRPKSCIEAPNFHIERVGKSRIIYCKECTYKSSEMKDMICHRLTHTGEKPHTCDKCGKGHTQIASLLAHKEAAHGEYIVEITCQYCGILIKGRNKAYKHIKRHTSKSMQCEICSKIFKNSNTFRVHMLRHKGVKNVQCELCPQKFFTASERYMHKKNIHLKSKYEYACDLCSYKSTRKHRMLAHKAKHVSSNFPCTQCGMFFDSAERQSAHERQHNDRNQACEHCDKLFYTKDYLRRHVIRMHSIKTPAAACKIKHEEAEDSPKLIQPWKKCTSATEGPDYNLHADIKENCKLRCKQRRVSTANKQSLVYISIVDKSP